MESFTFTRLGLPSTKMVMVFFWRLGKKRRFFFWARLYQSPPRRCWVVLPAWGFLPVRAQRLAMIFMSPNKKLLIFNTIFRLA